MANGNATADDDLLHRLADAGPLALSDLMSHLEVTRTAVYERLLRLMAEGLVDRELLRGGRGRPSYRYTLSHKARRLAGNNFADLAAVLWHEVLGIEDSRRRQHVIRIIAGALKDLYADAIQGTTLKARMESLRELLDEKQRVRCDVDTPSALPTLTLRDCPYLDLAEVDNFRRCWARPVELIPFPFRLTANTSLFLGIRLRSTSPSTFLAFSGETVPPRAGGTSTTDRSK